MSVSDLTGTTWVINNIPALYFYEFHVNFTSNNQSFDYLILDIDNYIIQYYNSSEDEAANVYDDTNHTWKDNAYKTITITGGADATNANLIVWLQENAIQYQQKSSFKSLLIYSHDNYIRLNLDGVDYKISKVSFSNIHIKEIGDLIDTAYSFDGKNFIRITDKNEHVLNNVNALYVSLSIDNAGAWIKVDSSGYKNSFSETADIYNSGHWDATYFENVNLQGYYTNLDGYDVTQYLQNGCYITVYSDY